MKHRVTLVMMNDEQDVGCYVDDGLVISADAACKDDVSMVKDTAMRLSWSLGCQLNEVDLTIALADDWNWDDVTASLLREGMIEPWDHSDIEAAIDYIENDAQCILESSTIEGKWPDIDGEMEQEDFKAYQDALALVGLLRASLDSATPTG